MPLKSFRAVVTNADKGNLKSLQQKKKMSFFTKKKNRFKKKQKQKQKQTNKQKNIFDKALTPFQDVLLLKQLFNGEVLIFRLLSFSVPKIMIFRHV